MAVGAVVMSSTDLTSSRTAVVILAGRHPGPTAERKERGAGEGSRFVRFSFPHNTHIHRM
jgi:hypothetical protein